MSSVPYTGQAFAHTLGSHLNWIFIVLGDDYDGIDSGKKGEFEDSVFK